MLDSPSCSQLQRSLPKDMASSGHINITNWSLLELLSFSSRNEETEAQRREETTVSYTVQLWTQDV